MSKDTFYFSHDYNARTDRKLVNVIMKHGMTGIGIYWCLVEMLYEEGGYLPNEYERISFELRTDTNVIQSIINDFDLFKTDLDKFWSDAVLERLQERCDKSEKARESINKRWEKYRSNTNVIQTNTKRNTIKKSKEEERKVKEKNKYAEFVSLTDDEYNKLFTQHGKYNTDLFIQSLDNYKGSTGKKYKDDYRTILSWVIDKVKKEGKYKQSEKLIMP